MSQVGVILPAAGQSSRFQGFKKKKPFVELKGRAVWVRTAEHFINRPDVCQTILVIAPDDLDWFREQFRANLAFMNLQVVAGGATRAQSVLNGMAALTDEAKYVAVHDAARPILTPMWIDSVFAAARRHRAAIPGLPVSSTVKRVKRDQTIEATVDREHLVLAQTPQVFERQLLQQSYAACPDVQSATDDASVVEACGHAVHVVAGWPMNIKITTHDDFKMAEQFLNAVPRPGGLKNMHPFADDLLR